MKLLFKKKTYLILAVILLAAGITVAISGFALAHFDIKELPQTEDRPWYQTVAVDGQEIWFGVEFPGGAISSGKIPVESTPAEN
ncbi:MAG: hypothetical protein Q4P20_09325 [Eubacteriales bacterium]|nr:hypothetical protein [Eubacteriales bacterium]